MQRLALQCSWKTTFRDSRVGKPLERDAASRLPRTNERAGYHAPQWHANPNRELYCRALFYGQITPDSDGANLQQPRERSACATADSGACARSREKDSSLSRPPAAVA